MTIELASKPRPAPRGEEKVWFEAAAEGWLALGRCRYCDRWFLPRVVCPHCWSEEVEMARASGKGHVHSFTILHRAGRPGFEADVPYAVALIETEEGVRVLTNIVAASPEDVRIGMPVSVVFEDRGEGLVVPQFTPSAG
jgi:uncharacterized OB-fold protein